MTPSTPTTVQPTNQSSNESTITVDYMDDQNIENELTKAMPDSEIGMDQGQITIETDNPEQAMEDLTQTVEQKKLPINLTSTIQRESARLRNVYASADSFRGILPLSVNGEWNLLVFNQRTAAPKHHQSKHKHKHQHQKSGECPHCPEGWIKRGHFCQMPVQFVQITYQPDGVLIEGTPDVVDALVQEMTATGEYFEETSKSEEPKSV